MQRRQDADDGSKIVPDGRLPDANQGAAHIRDVFGRMGFNDEEMVALLGAHALGRCHLDNSGYWGPWTRAETTMSNEYFKLLLTEKWTPKKTHKGKPWKGMLDLNCIWRNSSTGEAQWGRMDETG